MTAAVKAWDVITQKNWRRLVQPEETLSRIMRLFPIFGITRLANVTGLDTIGIPVVMACRPNSRNLSVSQGKGLTLAAAKVSAAMEAIEGWHAERPLLPLLHGSFEDLRYARRLVDPDILPTFIDSPFNQHLPIFWAEGTNLADSASIWVPYEMVHTNYVLPLPNGHGCFQASSNGLSSGNSWIEAVIHGLCEVIERDALTLWNQRDERFQDESRLDLETISDPSCRSLLERFARSGVAVGVWDLTSDVGVPVFLARIIQADAGVGAVIRPAVGCGAHLVPDIALSRALTEAAQSRLTFIAGARDDLFRDDYRRFLAEDAQRRWATRILYGPPARPFSAFDDWSAETLRDDLAELRRRLARVGLHDIIVFNLTRPEIGIPVVRVIVPGLEGIDQHSNYALGRRARAIAPVACG
jgi:YcaO-like protein with predicted kinase domain